MNLSVMKAEVRNFLYEPTAAFFSEVEITRWLNEAIRLMCAEAQNFQAIYQFSPTLMSGQSAFYDTEYPLPADVNEVFGVTCTNGKYKFKLKYRDFRLMQNTAVASGIPAFYHLRSATNQKLNIDPDNGLALSDLGTSDTSPTMVLGLYPVPSSATLQFFVYHYPDHYDLIDDTDIPRIPIEYRRGLIHYAASLGFQKEGAAEDAARHMGEFSTYMKRLSESMINNGQEESFPKSQTHGEDEFEEHYPSVSFLY